MARWPTKSKQASCVAATCVQKFPTDAITIEAWLSTSDDCHLGEFLSLRAL